MGPYNGKKFSMRNWTRTLNPHHMKRILTPSLTHASAQVDLAIFTYCSVRKPLFESALFVDFSG